MNPVRNFLRQCLRSAPDFRFASRLFAGLCLTMIGIGSASAQTAASGTIVGKIFKPATGEFVRHAEIRIEGTDYIVESEDGGSYRIGKVPAGTVKLVVTYTGYTPALATVTVVPGETVTQDINLANPLLPTQSTPGDGTPIMLGAFVVSSQAEGQAKAIQEQKRSMNIGDHVASDLFGDVAEGNVGEFLKHLPGVDLEYVQFDARGPRVRGMDPQYVGVTVDGVKLASADAFNATVGTDNVGNAGSRAFGFESISLSSVDSVEVFKSLSADLDADAPAGTINLRSKRAFDRQGRRISYQLGLSALGDRMSLAETPGPGDGSYRKVRPSGTLEYSDVFLNKRLGIVLNYNLSSIYNDFYQFQMTTVNRTPTATDARLAVPNLIVFTDGPKITDRATGTLTVDFKATPELSIGVTATLANYHAYWDNRQLRFQASDNNTGAAGRTTVVGEDPLASFSTGATSNGLISLAGDGADKFTDTVSVISRAQWRPSANLLVEGVLGWSESDNQYRSISEGKARGTPLNAFTGVKFMASRSSADSADWTITQIGGSDWANLANYGRPQITDEGRSELNEVYNAAIDVKWSQNWKLPTFLKFGVKTREEYRKFKDLRNWNSWEYIGPGGTTLGAPLATGGTAAGTGGSWVSIPTLNPIDLSTLGVNLNSLAGLPPTLPGRSLAASLFKAHPEYFSHTAVETAGVYFPAFIGNDRNIYERVDAAYLMGNARYKNLRLQAGLRYEKTTDDLEQFRQRSRAEVIGAGFTVDTTGRANTIPGLQYQFMTLPKAHRVTDYDGLFPSVNVSYGIIPNRLIAQFGYYKALSRPQLTVIAGVTTFNETAQVITTPNPGLLPEDSESYSGRLAYYLPDGMLSVGVFQNEVTNLRQTLSYAAGTWFDEFPDIDPVAYATYTVNTTVNVPGSRRFRGMEIDYRHRLTFLPGFLNQTSVFANYTRVYANERRGGQVPHQISAGANFTYKRLSFGTNVVWSDETPWLVQASNPPVVVRFRRERLRTDVNASFRLNKWATISLSGRDVGNVGMELIERRPGEPVQMVQKDIYGALWSLSLRGAF